MNWKELSHTELNQMLSEIYEERNEQYMSIISKNTLKEYEEEEKENIRESIQREKEEFRISMEKEKLKMEKEKQEIEEIKKSYENVNGVCSVYKGEAFEKEQKFILEQSFSNFTIDDEKKMKSMDIRMVKKEDEKFTIGIECKNKGIISKEDIDKFIRDKVTNNFKGNVFISTTAPISGKVEEPDTFIFDDTGCWIYSCNDIMIVSIIKSYINFLESHTQREDYSDIFLTLYTHFGKIKKEMKDMDMILLQHIGIDKQYRHLFLTTKTKCIGQRNPY